MADTVHLSQAAFDRLKAEHDLDDAWFDSPMVFVGSVDEICDKMRHLRKTFGASYFVVFEPAMEAIAPIVQELAGT